MRKWITIIENVTDPDPDPDPKPEPKPEPKLPKIQRDYALLDDAGKKELRKTLVVREERRRVIFNKNRSPKNGDALKRTRDELGYVRNQMRIEGIV